LLEQQVAHLDAKAMHWRADAEAATAAKTKALGDGKGAREQSAAAKKLYRLCKKELELATRRNCLLESSLMAIEDELSAAAEIVYLQEQVKAEAEAISPCVEDESDTSMDSHGSLNDDGRFEVTPLSAPAPLVTVNETSSSSSNPFACDVERDHTTARKVPQGVRTQPNPEPLGLVPKGHNKLPDNRMSLTPANRTGE
jgi:hypothetical protein